MNCELFQYRVIIMNRSKAKHEDKRDETKEMAFRRKNLIFILALSVVASLTDSIFGEETKDSEDSKDSKDSEDSNPNGAILRKLMLDSNKSVYVMGFFISHTQFYMFLSTIHYYIGPL